MKTEKRSKCVVISLVVLFILTVLFLASVNSEEDLRIVGENLLTLSENWTIRYGDYQEQAVSLPVSLDVTPGTAYEASLVLPSVANQMNYILLRSSMQDIVVYLAGQEIYRAEKLETQGITSPIASTWVMFKLPQDFQGETLTLVLKSEVAAFSGHINTVMLGEDSSLVYYVFKQGFSGFIVFLVLFAMGLLAIVFSIFTKSVADNRFLYLGLLVIATSIWILSEAKLLQFFLGNRYIIGGISYLMVPLMGAFFSLYVKETIFVEPQNKRLMQMMAGLYLFLLIASMFLQGWGISAFIETMNIMFIVIFLNIMVFAFLVVSELVKQKNQNATQFFKYMSVLSISVILEGIAFFTNHFDYTSAFLRIGSLVFFGLLLMDSYLYFKRSLQSQKERDLYETLAYKDVLTGGNNRAAFERDFEKLRNKEESFRLVLLDLNELKYINDHFGHGSGDEAIKTLYRMMHNAFMPEGVCYRIGGDEFAILMENTAETVVKRSIIQMRKPLKRAESHVEYPLEVAIGTDVYDAWIWENLTRFYHHVDQKMYADKLEIKKMRQARLALGPNKKAIGSVDAPL
ncbi:MAG: diguanylate cyclase [Acetobacterium sp.]|nr:diguanylate cyclase [Acetobacterium sp.]